MKQLLALVVASDGVFRGADPCAREHFVLVNIPRLSAPRVAGLLRLDGVSRAVPRFGTTFGTFAIFLIALMSSTRAHYGQ